MNQTKVPSSQSKRIRVLCPTGHCHTRLCDRVYGDGVDLKGWILKFRSGKWPAVISDWFVITCPNCNTSHKITATEGIVESLRHSYASTGIQTQAGESPDRSQ